jgi:nicotinate phosphoribosyltransferase
VGALKTDLYQLTMAAGYFHRGMRDAVATCEMFVRRLPRKRRYLVAMGLCRVLDYLEALSFAPDQIEYLSTVPALADAMTPAFVEFLKGLRFTGDVWAVPEGTVMFAGEPFLRVRAPVIEAQLIETFVLSVMNHATMVASKAARVMHAAGDAAVLEFGSRRTHDEAAVDAARAACAVGFVGTSNVEAGRRFGLPVMGTAAHMWTMAHPSEQAAFEGYVAVFPNAAVLLIDTYDTLRGARLAAEVARDKLKGVRIDSGDLEGLSREVRAILDREGCSATKIVVSGDLNEHKIEALRARGAPIDVYGVGTEVVTSLDAPSLGGVYKIVALERDGVDRPIAKFSEGKATYPGAHQVTRYQRAGELAFDVLGLSDEVVPSPADTTGAPLLVPVMRGGRRVSSAGGAGSFAEVSRHAKASLASLPESLRSLEVGDDASAYPVRISGALRALSERVREECGAQEFTEGSE